MEELGMKLVKIKTYAPKENLMDAFSNSEEVNARVKFDEKRGRPVIHTKEKSERLKMTCEMVGGPTKDNGFLVGCFFLGGIREKDGERVISGVIMTAPLYHLLLIGFCIYFLIQSIILGGITLVPLFGVLFTFVLFKDEYKKEGIIKRFISRAVKFAELSAEADRTDTD
jgi:hypothetical protein